MLVLVGTGLFVYSRLQSDLNEGVDATLEARATQVTRPGEEPLPATQAEEGFAQALGADGRLIDSTPRVPGGILTPQEIRRAGAGEVIFERRVRGIEGVARVLARPASGEAGSPAVVVVGQSLDDREEALRSVITSFAVGGLAAVLLASVLGYGLAAAGLRPMEAMRRRAGDISLDHPGERLPLPAAEDEVRRLAETLNVMLERLEHSFERERRFVADASHELRTPVAVIKTEIETTLRSDALTPDAREALVAAVEECDNLSQLAEDLLVIARAADGKLPVRLEEIGAREALESVRQRFTDRASEHGRAIVVDAPEDLVVRADPLRLRQALGNLTDNALRHGVGQIKLSAHSGQGIAIEVSDEGPGFEEGVEGRAFERFARGDAARTRGGAGLGMAIVQAVAEAHEGHAEIARAPTTTVRLCLPKAPEPVGLAA